MRRFIVIALGCGLVGVAVLVSISVSVFEPLPSGTTAELVVVHKSERRLELYRDRKLLKSYPVSLGRNPIGPKQQQGDSRTPEGEYRIDDRKPDSSFHRALHISYPSTADASHARSRGVDPGGQIMIHGLRNGLGWLGPLHRAVDWTDGCVAVTDREMDELWSAVPDGTRIILVP